MKSISLFSNCGAGDLGYRAAGFSFAVIAELDQRRLEVAALNHPEASVVWGDLRETWPKVVETWRTSEGPESSPYLLAACPPCQGLSSARSDRGLAADPDAGSRDRRNLLVEVIAAVAGKLLPRAIVVENVPAFLTRAVRHPETRGPVSAASLLIDRLRGRYEVFPLLVDLMDYGVPQTRQRSFLTFVRRDLGALRRLCDGEVSPYPIPTHAPDHGGAGGITLGSVLTSFGLPELDAGSESGSRDPARELHVVPVWDDRRYAMVSAIPPSSGASAWDNDVCPECGATTAGAEDAECPECGSTLLRPVVAGEGGARLVRGFRDSSYRRMAPDRPASTVTTASGNIGSDRTIHPWENRLLSPLECALLQTFPQGFNWGDAIQRWGATPVRRMIGEAVPPLFTRQHGEALSGLLGARDLPPLLPCSDVRCQKAHGKLKRGARSRCRGSVARPLPPRRKGRRDRLSRGKRSKIMRSVGQKDTAAEMRLRRAVWAAGMRYRLNHRIGGTRPDFVFVSARVAVFVDGCFWHGCPDHYTAPVNNAAFWQEKLEGNVARDRRNDLELESRGWTVLRFWECEVNDQLNAIIQKIEETLRR